MIENIAPEISPLEMNIDTDTSAINSSNGRKGSHVGESIENTLERGDGRRISR